MKRRFNITGSCTPQRNYMVRLDDRLKNIREADPKEMKLLRSRIAGKQIRRDERMALK